MMYCRAGTAAAGTAARTAAEGTAVVGAEIGKDGSGEHAILPLYLTVCQRYLHGIQNCRYFVVCLVPQTECIVYRHCTKIDQHG